MKETTIIQIAEAVSGKLTQGGAGSTVTGVSTDSRATGKGDVFFALKGDKYDAHDFIPEAVKNGAGTVVVSRECGLPHDAGLNIITVDDTTKALQGLAKWYVSELGVRKVGITGSTGKTTTKDMLAQICMEKYNTGKTAGNLNNHIGLPLTLLSFDESTQVGVFEMGVEVIREMHMLADIARPHIALITNIGVSHIASFGSRENILKGKMEITDFFSEEDLLIVNEENDLLTRENVSGAYRVLTVGSSGRSDYILGAVDDFGEDGIEFSLERGKMSGRFKLGVPGRHNAINASLAIAAAMEIGVSMEEAGRGLAKVSLMENRLRLKGKDGIKVIDDTYNASPDSMRAAIDLLQATRGMRKIAVLGDMLELGDDSKKYHRQIGGYAAQKGVDLLLLTGEMSAYAAEEAAVTMGELRVIYHRNPKKLEDQIKAIARPGDVILVKGSRGMAMEQIVRKILG